MFLCSGMIAAVGIACVIFPQILLLLLNLDSQAHTLARVIGIMLVALGIYYYVMSSDEVFRPLWLATVYVRLGVFPLSLLLYGLGWMDPAFIAIFVIDACCGLWTALAMRRS
jgi:hypothetical protein